MDENQFNAFLDKIATDLGISIDKIIDFDLYAYDFKTEKENRLTESARLFSPYYDKEINAVLAINTYDGTSNIVVYDIIDSSYTQLTDFNNGIQIFSITEHKEKYLIDAVVNHERDFYLINQDNGEIELFKKEPWDIRDPNIKNNITIYSDDRTGIYNLYFKDHKFDTR